jgi:hypothetical protein
MNLERPGIEDFDLGQIAFMYFGSFSQLLKDRYSSTINSPKFEHLRK